MTTVAALLHGHPAFAAGGFPTGPGFELAWAMPAAVPVTDRDALLALGIIVSENAAPSNLIFAAGRPSDLPISIDFAARTGNTIVIEDAACLQGRIGLQGNGHLAVFRRSSGKSLLRATFRNNDGALFYGIGISARRLDLLIEGPAVSVVLGEDCMVSVDVVLRTSDSHGIFDMATGKVINRPESIRVGPHVWLGDGAMLMPGVSVGAGSIVGARSIVTRDVPAHAAAAGAPARVVREGVSWTRRTQPGPTQVEAQRSSRLLGWTHGEIP